MPKTLDFSKLEPLTEQDNLELLRGKDGVQGIDGKDGLGIDGKDGDPGGRGEDGKDAPRISDHKIINNRLIVTYADGEKYDAGHVVGRDGDDGERGTDGEDGKDGLGIADMEISQKGDLIVTLTNGKSKVLGNVIGPPGEQGDKGDKGDRGEQGIQGRSVLGGHINRKGHLIMTYSGPETQDVGRVRGIEGKKGKDGKNGGAVTITGPTGEGENLGIIHKNEDYLALRSDRTIIMDTESGTPGIRNLTLPSAFGIRGTHLNIVSKYGNKLRVIITAVDGGPINGCDDITLLFAEEMINVQSDGFEWFLVK